MFTKKKGMFWWLFWLNNFFKMINLFVIFASEDGKHLLSRLYVAIFLFCAEKCPKDAEDAEVGELCGSAPPHPVRCPVIHGSLVKTIPRSDRVSTKNGWKSVLLENINCVHLNRFRLKHLIPIEHDLIFTKEIDCHFEDQCENKLG